MSSSSSVPYTNPNGGKNNYQGHSNEALGPPSSLGGNNIDQFIPSSRNISYSPSEQYMFGGRVPSGHNYPHVPSSSPSVLRQAHGGSHFTPPAQISRPTPHCIEIQIQQRVLPQDQYRQNMSGYNQKQQPFPTWSRTSTGNVSNCNSGGGYNSLDRQSPRPRRPVPPLPTSQNDSRVGPLQFGPPQKQFISSPTTPQQEKHSSQKTIFLQPVPATPERIPHNSGEYGVHPSTSDPNLPQTYPPLTQGLPGNPNQPNATFTLRSPLYIHASDTEPNNPGAPGYNPYLPTDHMNGQYHNLKYGEPACILNIGGATNPPSYQVFPVTGGASDSEQMFGHQFLPNPGNRCAISGHSPYVRTPSSESDRRSIPTPPGEDRHMVNPQVLFPPVSIGAVTEPTPVDRPVSSSGGGQEEADYTRGKSISFTCFIAYCGSIFFILWEYNNIHRCSSVLEQKLQVCGDVILRP